jgi:tetratricopeptide (TPR) repeat protein
MRKLMILSFSLMISTMVFAQSDRYTAAMEKAVGELQAAEQSRDFSTPANTFERISAAAPQEAWLPAYYQSYCHIMQAVSAMQQGQKEKITAYLEKAQQALDKAKASSAENPEILALQGYIYTGHIWADPMSNGPMYTPKSMAAYEQAIAAGPEFPRAYHLMGMHLFYMPEMYGGGAARAYEYLQQAEEKFAKFKPESALHPVWGSYFNQQLLEQATAKIEKKDK